jgi:tetratricopeptide (TPR) repeat protein
MRHNRNQSRPHGVRLRLAAALAAGAILTLVAGCSHKSVESDLEAGDQAMQNTKLADAESSYQAAAAEAPNDPRPHIALGNLYIFEQKPGPAELEYMKVLDLDPKNAPAHAALGNIYNMQSQSGMAEAQYRAAVVLDPAKTAYRLSLGTILDKASRRAEAEAEFRTAIGLEPKNAHAHLALANLLNEEPSRQSEAQEEFAQVKTLDPSLLAVSTTAAPTATSPAGTPPAVASVAPAPSIKLRDINPPRRFMLTHDSPVYAAADDGSSVVGQVHRGKFVHITGIGGKWFRVKLRNGTEGFIPVAAAE